MASSLLSSHVTPSTGLRHLSALSDNEQGRAIRDAETEGIQPNRHEALPPERITAVETGGCPHTAVRDDVSQNLDALGQLMVKFAPELLFVESGGDNLAAQVSRELADYTIYVIDVSGGDKIPRKGGPGSRSQICS